jgi:hypothetical protein
MLDRLHVGHGHAEIDRRLAGLSGTGLDEGEQGGNVGGIERPIGPASSSGGGVPLREVGMRGAASRVRSKLAAVDGGREQPELVDASGHALADDIGERRSVVDPRLVGSMALGQVVEQAVERLRPAGEVELPANEGEALGPVRQPGSLRGGVSADEEAPAEVFEPRPALLGRGRLPSHPQRWAIHSRNSPSPVIVNNNAAGVLAPGALRTLDAIHVATALAIGDDLAEIVTYDERMVEAARSLGLPTIAPR